MTSKEIITKYLDFFIKRGHKQIPNVSLVPENDPTLLYVNSGMFPLVPYLSGGSHPLGKRLVNVQRCLRFFEDLDNIGNTNRHTTAFHMLGNWSLGDYFKKEQLTWIYEFYIEILGLEPNRIFATVFGGDSSLEEDQESVGILKNIFERYGVRAKIGERIFSCGRDDNWWQRGDAVGELGGPDSEIYYYLGEGSGIGKKPTENQDLFLEIGNSVFMQFKKKSFHEWQELKQKNVDFGGGLERIALAVQNKKDIFQTDNFWPIISKIEDICGSKYESDEETKKSMRVIADHMRASVFLAMDGVYPSNKDQGYILRRLLRRMIRYSMPLNIKSNISVSLLPTIVEMFTYLYPNLPEMESKIKIIFEEEEGKFRYNLSKIAKNITFEEYKARSEKDLARISFDYYQSDGYPPEIFIEDIKVIKKDIHEGMFYKYFKENFKKHQKTSREGSAKKFKGGLADKSEQTIKYHTATHLIHQALCDVLGADIQQNGSNITGDRLRFDFLSQIHPNSKQLKDVENLVNNKIKEGLNVYFIEMEKTKALALGAKAFFGEKYPSVVKVYFIGNNREKNSAYSKELCGGPHVNKTSTIGKIVIYKFEKIGQNNFRIYAR